MPSDFLSPCADELTPDQRRERIASILARAVARKIANQRRSNVVRLNDKPKSRADTTPTSTEKH
jgi:hypothetical protein